MELKELKDFKTGDLILVKMVIHDQPLYIYTLDNNSSGYATLKTFALIFVDFKYSKNVRQNLGSIFQEIIFICHNGLIELKGNIHEIYQKLNA